MKKGGTAAVELEHGRGSPSAGVSVGFLSSLAVGAIFVSGPVGWTVALVASAVGGYFAQEAGKLIGKAMYDQFGNRIDLLEVTRVGRFCG